MKSIILTFIFFISFYAFTQEQAKTPKIGLVLSGGGAKGLAHIGILKAIDESGLKIDYIGGTSMGAIIGGLYASGYSGNQIDSIVKNTDFENIIKDNLPRSIKSFYEKDNDEKYAVILPFDNFKIGIPLAFSKGQNIDNLFNKLTYKVNFIEDFNELPIPFICIATDIETGKAVVLNKGYLPQAIKASAALPSLFNPIEINGQFLIDGGIVNNYPVYEVKNMGADIIIGVNVQDRLLLKNQLTSAPNIFMQIIGFQMYEGMEDKIKATDIYIEPNTDGFNVISFDASEEILLNGELEAQKYMSKFKELALRQAKEKQKTFEYDTNHPIFLEEITINGNKNFSRAYILGKMRLIEGQKITFTQLEEGLNSLDATQNFNRINYKLEKTQKGRKLILELTETKNKTFLKLAIHYDGLYKTAVLTNLTKKNIFLKNDVASLDAIVGDNMRYNFEYYVDNGFYWSFGLKSRYNQFKSDLFADITDNNIIFANINKLSIKYADFSNQIYIQTLFRQVFLLGTGLEQKYISVYTETFNPEDGNQKAYIIENNNFLSSNSYLIYDTYDHKYFPKKGFSLKGNFQWYLLASDRKGVLPIYFNRFSNLQTSLGFVKTFLKKLTFHLELEQGLTIGENPASLNFFLGGYGFNTINNIKHFFGYDFLSLSGDSYIKSLFGLEYEFYKNNYLNFYTNYANIGNNIFSDFSQFTTLRYSGYAIGYSLKTILGPIEIKYSWSPEINKNYWLFNIGFWF